MPTAPPEETGPVAAPGEATLEPFQAEPEGDVRPPPPDEMIVTGSRIRRKDLAGPAPVIVFSREQILASGRANIGEFLQSMPEQGNAINRGTNNAGDGSVRLSLRDMGPKSTLVLLKAGACLQAVPARTSQSTLHPSPPTRSSASKC
jgi:iron complex outermembrane receptor protein